MKKLIFILLFIFFSPSLFAGSCPKGYKLVNNSCQSDGTNSSGSCPKGYKLVNNSCQSDGSKNNSDYSNNSLENKSKFKKNKYNLNDPALNKCFKKMLGEKRYQEVIYSNSAKPNEKESVSIAGCQNDPDYAWQESIAVGFNTMDNFYDIFDGNKVENCISSTKHVFEHEITDYKQIKQLQRWGQTPQGNLKNHTYIFLKNKGRDGNKVKITKPVPVYAPVDSYLILHSRYRLSASGLQDVQWRLMFQVGCELVYRFDHLDTPSDRILNYVGNVKINDNQNSSVNVKVLPPLKIKAGELVAYTKGTPMAGSWDFGVLDINNNNELPKRLSKYENHPTGKQYKYAACPYDYYDKNIQKKYMKKMKGKKCNPKEIR